MSKFDAALKARKPEPPASVFVEEPTLSARPDPQENPVVQPYRKVGRPAGKRSDDANTQVTGYVPADLYYEVRIKLMERKRKNKRAKADFSDLLREWMERWLAEQA